VTIALGAAVAATVAVTATSTPALRRSPGHGNATATHRASPAALRYANLLSAIGTRPAGSAVAQAAAQRARLGETEEVAARKAGPTMPASGVLVSAATGPASAPGAASGSAGQQLPPAGPAQQADLFVIARQTLSPAVVQAIGRLPGVAAVNQLDA